MEIIHAKSDQQFIELHEKYGSSIALGRILALVENEKCETIIIEDEPEEKEYKAEYEEFYKTVFAIKDHRSPLRVHFFKEVIESTEDIKNLDKRYLGYCDIRPTKPETISTALIDQSVFVRTNYDYIFLICKKKYEIKFLDKTLSVEAFPYIQQDGQIIRCAQAALASIALHLGEDKSGPDFTKIASTLPTGYRSIPSQGLTAEQIGFCFKELGKDPLFYDYTFSQDAEEFQHREQIIYRYLESGIPVLIGIDAGSEMHALVVIGHTFSPDSWLAQTSTSYYQQPKTGWLHHCSTNWIEHFVIQDDNLGPYMLAPSDFLRYFACKLIIVPLIKGIYLPAEDAEIFVGDLISPRGQNIVQWFISIIKQDEEQGNKLNDHTRFWFDQFVKHVDNEELVLRTYLRKSDEWKREQTVIPSYDEFSDKLLTLPMPEYIWVIEISWPQIFRHKRYLCGEIILDPTNRYNNHIPMVEQTWLWVHVPGVIMTRNVKDGAIEQVVLHGKDEIRGHRKIS